MIVQKPKSELKKILGLGFGIAVIIGGTIGVGILRTPGPVAGLLHDKWLILAAWAFGGLYVTLAAFSLAELAAMLPKAGGAFNYVKAAFGNYAGFVTGWFDYIVNSIAPAYYAIVIGEYLSILFPSLAGAQTALAVGIIVIFTFLHLAGLRSGSAAQKIITTIKLAALLGLVVACFIHGPDTSSALTGLQTKPIVEGGLFLAFLRSLQLIMGTYDGWGSVIFFAEEDSNPGKNIPKALFTGIAIIISVYLLINIALLYVLPIGGMMNAALPASDAASVIFGEWGSTVITLVALFSLLGILNALVMITPRILFGLSREGYFNRTGEKINKGGTPVTALIISNLIAVILIVVGSFEQLFSLGAFMTMAVNTLIFASVFMLRRKQPELPRPYRAWGYPVTTFIALAVSASLFVGFAIADYKNFLLVAAITIISHPAFRLISKRKAF